MIEVVSSDEFGEWVRKLKDRQANLRIFDRIDRLVQGNPGDVKPIGGGISEMRLTYGPGYRIYYMHDGQTLVVLLVGGDKSTQPRDIKKAHELAERWRTNEGGRSQ